MGIGASGRIELLFGWYIRLWMQFEGSLIGPHHIQGYALFFAAGHPPIPLSLLNPTVPYVVAYVVELMP